MNLTPDEFKKAMDNAVKSVEANVGKILMNGANVGSALMQQRVFNKGKATSGKKMMYKSKPYKKLRLDAGLQVAHKDLTFTGNLFNSLTMLSANDKQVSYGFNNSETAEIAGYQETSDKQVNEPIFTLSKKEVKTVQDAMSGDVIRICMSAIESYPNMPTIKEPNQTERAKPKTAKTKMKAKKKPTRGDNYRKRKSKK